MGAIPQEGIRSGRGFLLIATTNSTTHCVREAQGTAGPRPIRIAFIVSHPIQYYVPLYRRLSRKSDVSVRVFYTWHGGTAEVWDDGFHKDVAWDIPLTEGYEQEVVPNEARDPGTHHFWGVRNSELVERVIAWQPDVVHLTGYAYASHLWALRRLDRGGIPVLFRGDSHLLDGGSGLRKLGKRLVLPRVFRHPAGFLYVGTHNREYYRYYGVPEEKLFYCPHSIEVERFAEPMGVLERDALAWRRSLGIDDQQVVVLFAGKLQRKKRPLLFMETVVEMGLKQVTAVMVGDGEMGGAVREKAARYPRRFRVLSFQNQSRMPLVYRLGDLFVLPSAYGETWGLGVNEAMSCGRPVLISDRVGCGPDLVERGVNGEVFRSDDWKDFQEKLRFLLEGEQLRTAMRAAAQRTASRFGIEASEQGLVEATLRVAGRTESAHSVKAAER